MGTMYFAGGCLWGVQAYMKKLPGVVTTEAGRANGATDKLEGPYDGYAECVKTVFDESQVSVAELMAYFFETIDPYSINRQGVDVGEKYRTGVYSTDPSLLEEAARYIVSRPDSAHVVVEVKPLKNYVRSAEEHQDYLDKHPVASNVKHRESLDRYIAEQFANPRGLGGRIVMRAMKRQNLEMYEVTEAFLKPEPQDAILDIGCGNGFMMERLSRAYRCRLIGTDISRDILKVAKRRVGGKRADFVCCSVDSMPIESGAIDKALTINTLYFWNDLQKGFEEVSRVLKPGGAFVCTHYSNRSLDALPHTQFGYWKHTGEETSSAARSAGFEVEAEPIMGNRGCCLICRKCDI